MSAVVGIIAPVCAIVLLGYGVGRTRLMSAEGVRVFSNFVFYVAIPAFLFRAMAQGPAAGVIEWSMVGAFFATLCGVYFGAFTLARRGFGLNGDEGALMAMCCAYGNVVQLGLPLVQATYGAAGAQALAILIAFHSMTLIPLTTILVELGRGRRGNLKALARSTGATLARHPVILAMVAGLAYGATGLGLAAPVAGFVDLLADAAGPTALFALGATLTQFRLAGNLVESGTVSLVKIVVQPALVWLLMSQVLHVSPLWTGVATIAAAMPTGINCFILAQVYDTFVARAVSAVLISTLLSLATVSVVLAALTG